MRIISGNLKGKKINYLRNFETRPLKDSVKENIFNVLDHSKLFKVKIKDSCVLDLYSGVGSFGIECISRGAKKVTFIEKNIIAYDFLKENLENLSLINKSKVFNEKIESSLKNFSDEKFNIFFFDPPFKDNNFIENLQKIKEKKIFIDDHVVIIHRERKKFDHLENLINIKQVKEYGRSKIIFGFFNLKTV